MSSPKQFQNNLEAVAIASRMTVKAYREARKEFGLFLSKEERQSLLNLVTRQVELILEAQRAANKHSERMNDLAYNERARSGSLKGHDQVSLIAGRWSRVLDKAVKGGELTANQASRYLTKIVASLMLASGMVGAPDNGTVDAHNVAQISMAHVADQPELLTLLAKYGSDDHREPDEV